MNVSNEILLQNILELLSIGSDYMSWESPDLPARFLNIASRLIHSDGVILHVQSEEAVPPRLAAYSGIDRNEIDLVQNEIVTQIRSSVSYPFELEIRELHLVCTPFFRGHYLEGAISFARRNGQSNPFSAADVQIMRHLGRIGAGVFHASTSIGRLRNDIQTRDYLMSRLYILYETSNALVRTQEIEIRLHVILTATTLGEGLGFNRALLYLIDPSDSSLFGRMGVGPLSVTEARSTWDRMLRSHTPGYEILREIVKTQRMPDEALNNQTQTHRIPAEDPGVFMRTIRERRAFLIEHQEPSLHISDSDRFILDSDCFATVPLILADRSIGLIAVDNRFNQKRISPEDLQFLWMISNLAAASIDNSNSYERIVRLNKELRYTREALVAAEKASAVGELTLYLAHEIRNPLVAAGGFAGRLLNTLTEGTPEHDYAAIIRRETLRMERILSDVLKTTKIPHSRPGECDLHQLIQEVLELLSFSIEERGILSTNVFEPRKIMVLADPLLLKQAIHNIVSNSIQAQPNGGSINICTSLGPDSVTLRISDSGPGVDASKLNDLFKPFYTTKSEGTGLGLFLTKRIFDSFQAHIKPYLPEAGGLCFIITFPMDRREGNDRHENNPDSR